MSVSVWARGHTWIHSGSGAVTTARMGNGSERSGGADIGSRESGERSGAAEGERGEDGGNAAMRLLRRARRGLTGGQCGGARPLRPTRQRQGGSTRRDRR